MAVKKGSMAKKTFQARKIEAKSVVSASDPFTDKIGHFSVSEYCITGEMPPQDIFDAIVEFHIKEMNPVREAFGSPISVSKHSGYRPYEHEIAKGRAGTSQHSFKDIWAGKKRGAADYTANDVKKLLSVILEKSNYRRVCYYPNDKFIHCDHKGDGTRREYYECASPTSKWKLVKFF